MMLGLLKIDYRNHSIVHYTSQNKMYDSSRDYAWYYEIDTVSTTCMDSF